MPWPSSGWRDASCQFFFQICWEMWPVSETKNRQIQFHILDIIKLTYLLTKEWTLRHSTVISDENSRIRTNYKFSHIHVRHLIFRAYARCSLYSNYVTSVVDPKDSRSKTGTTRKKEQPMLQQQSCWTCYKPTLTLWTTTSVTQYICWKHTARRMSHSPIAYHTRKKRRTSELWLGLRKKYPYLSRNTRALF